MVWMGRVRTVWPRLGLCQRQWMGRVQTTRADSRIHQKWWSMDGGKRPQPAICGKPFVRPMCVIRPVFIMVTECGLSLKTYVILIAVNDNRSGARRHQRLLILLVLVRVPVLVVTSIFFRNLLLGKIFLTAAFPDVPVKKRISATARFGCPPRVLFLILARLQEEEIQRIFALLLICQKPCPDVIIFVQEDEIGKRERNSGIPT